MVASGPSSSGKTVFTKPKQALNKLDKQFETIYWFYSEWQDGYKDCPRISFVSGMPSSLNAYLELSRPKAMVLYNMMMQCASSELIAQSFTQKRHHQNLSVILILQNLYCQGKVMRNVHLNTEYVVLFRNTRDKSQFGMAVGTETLQSTCDRYRSNSLQLDRQTMFVIGAVPTCATRRHAGPPQVRALGPPPLWK